MLLLAIVLLPLLAAVLLALMFVAGATHNDWPSH